MGYRLSKTINLASTKAALVASNVAPNATSTKATYAASAISTRAASALVHPPRPLASPPSAVRHLLLGC